MFVFVTVHETNRHTCVGHLKHDDGCRFVGGELSTCYNAVDRHVESGRGEQDAIIHDSPVTKSITRMTYRELQKQVILH